MFNQPLLVGSVFLGGVASFLSPCILPVVPVYLGILSKGKKTVLNTFLFILGLSLTFVSIGFSFSFLTESFGRNNCNNTGITSDRHLKI